MAKAKIVEHYIQQATSIKEFFNTLDESTLNTFVDTKLAELGVAKSTINAEIITLAKAYIKPDPEPGFSSTEQEIEYYKHAIHAAIEHTEKPLPPDLQTIRTLFHVRQIAGLLEHKNTFCNILDSASTKLTPYQNHEFAKAPNATHTSVEQWTREMMESVFNFDNKRLLIDTFFDPQKVQQHLAQKQTPPAGELAVALPLFVISEIDGLWLQNTQDAIRYASPNCLPNNYTPLVMYDPHRAARDFQQLSTIAKQQNLSEYTKPPSTKWQQHVTKSKAGAAGASRGKGDNKTNNGGTA